jgi:uncharacterized protein
VMEDSADAGRRAAILGVALRVFVFAFMEVVGLSLFAALLTPLVGYLVSATMATFAAAAVANAVALRIYERGRLSDIGLGWESGSGANLALGLAGGAGTAILTLGLPLITGLAELAPNPEYPLNWGSLVFVSVVLLFGAVGEELLFRGYGFQVLMAAMGPYATILPVSVLFGMAHSNNQNVTGLGLTNTILWGVVFGVAFLRSGDLWLPIGLHYGWNVVLPLFGVNLSGFTMGMTGRAMKWNVGALWSGGSYGPEAGLIATLALIPLGVFLWKAPIRRHTAFLLRSLEEA